MPPPPERAPALAGVERLALAAPLALAVLAYARVLHGELQLDDIGGVLENRAVHGVGAWLGSLSPRALLTARPLTALTFALDWTVGGRDPFAFHLGNLLLHLANVLLASRLAERAAALAGAARPRAVALGAAGLFAVHPLASAAVSYVSQRAELLASALYLGTLLLLLAADRADGGGDRARATRTRVLALGAFLLGLAAKPVVLTVPLAYLALRLAAAPGPAGEGGRPRRPLAGVVLATAPLLVAGALFGAALLAVLSGPDAGLAVPGATPWRYLLTSARALTVYLRLVLWPAGQSADHLFPLSPGLGDPATLAAVAAILALAGAAAWLLRAGRRTPGPDAAPARLAGLGLAWFLVVPAVTTSAVPLADPLAEHRAYLAAFGLLLAAATWAEALAARLDARRALAAAWAATLLALAAATHARNAVWETREALWTDAAAKAPASSRAHLNLGEAYEARGRTAEALAEYERALSLAGGAPRQRGRVLMNLGAALMQAGRVDEARRALTDGLRLLPDHDGLLANLAVVEGASGDAALAEALARRALAVNPDQPTAWVALGNLALERQDFGGAAGAFARALDLDPERGEAQAGRGVALLALGREADACAALREALRGRLPPAYLDTLRAEVRARCP